MSARLAAAVSTTVLVAAEHREPTLDLVTAARNLGCRTDELVEAVVAGFPAVDGPDGPRFDELDVINLGLTTGSGNSLAELSERRALKIAVGDPAAWVQPRRSRLELAVSCSAGEHAALPFRPETESYDAVLHRWAVTGPATAQAEVTTVGARLAVADRVAREAYWEVFNGLVCGRYRFAWLPKRLRATPEVAIARGELDCGVGSVLVERLCREGGLTARTRTGFLLGLVGVEHGWTEVWLGGRWLTLDPVLAYLATRHPGTSEDFTSFCLGSTPAKRLAWAAPAGARLTDHACPDGGTTVVRCRQLPAVVLAKETT